MKKSFANTFNPRLKKKQDKHSLSFNRTLPVKAWESMKEAVEYSLASDKTVREVAQDLGIAHSNLRRWRTQYRKHGELAFPGHGKDHLTPQEEKVRKLQKELHDIKIERDILKKALAIFTKKP